MSSQRRNETCRLFCLNRKITVVQPLRVFGKVDTKDELYWDGIAECYHQGLIKNVGVCNYGPTLVEQCHRALKDRGVPLA